MDVERYIYGLEMRFRLLSAGRREGSEGVRECLKQMVADEEIEMIILSDGRIRFLLPADIHPVVTAGRHLFRDIA